MKLSTVMKRISDGRYKPTNRAMDIDELVYVLIMESDKTSTMAERTKVKTLLRHWRYRSLHEDFPIPMDMQNLDKTAELWDDLYIDNTSAYWCRQAAARYLCQRIRHLTKDGRAVDNDLADVVVGKWVSKVE